MQAGPPGLATLVGRTEAHREGWVCNSATVRCFFRSVCVRVVDLCSMWTSVFAGNWGARKASVIDRSDLAFVVGIRFFVISFRLVFWYFGVVVFWCFGEKFDVCVCVLFFS